MLLIVGAFLGLVGVIYGILRSTQTKTDEKLDQHITQDVEAHERLARLETKVETLEEEVTSLRKRFHDLYDYVMRGVGALIQDFKAEILRLIGK